VLFQWPFIFTFALILLSYHYFYNKNKKNIVLELALIWFLWIMVFHQAYCQLLPVPIKSYKHNLSQHDILRRSPVILFTILFFWNFIILRAFRSLLLILAQYQFDCYIVTFILSLIIMAGNMLRSKLMRIKLVKHVAFVYIVKLYFFY
jgi:hypothetical protein